MIYIFDKNRLICIIDNWDDAPKNLSVDNYVCLTGGIRKVPFWYKGKDERFIEEKNIPKIYRLLFLLHRS